VAYNPPKCCHTCDHFGPDGKCYRFHRKPPPGFADEVERCDEWVIELPVPF